jgi:hypothetical protein
MKRLSTSLSSLHVGGCYLSEGPRHLARVSRQNKSKVHDRYRVGWAATPTDGARPFQRRCPTRFGHPGFSKPVGLLSRQLAVIGAVVDPIQVVRPIKKLPIEIAGAAIRMPDCVGSFQDSCPTHTQRERGPDKPGIALCVCAAAGVAPNRVNSTAADRTTLPHAPPEARKRRARDRAALQARR